MDFYLSLGLKICYNSRCSAERLKAPSSYMKRKDVFDLSDATLHFAPVAQMDRASACGAEGHRFESCRVYQ